MTYKRKERMCGDCPKRDTCSIIAKGSTSGCWESVNLSEEERYRDVISDIVFKNKRN